MTWQELGRTTGGNQYTVLNLGKRLGGLKQRPLGRHAQGEAEAAGFAGAAEAGLMQARRSRSAQVFARIVRLLSRHFFISVSRSSSLPSGSMIAYRGEKIAGAILGRKTLALEPEGAAGVAAGRDGELDRAVERRNPDLAPEHGLIERDRKVEPQVRAVALEDRVRRNRHRDEQVAGAAPGAARPWPLRRICWPSARPAGNLDLDLLAGRQMDALLRAVRGFGQRDGQRRGEVAPAGLEALLVGFERRAAARPRTARTAEDVLEKILEAAKAPPARAPPPPGPALRPER